MAESMTFEQSIEKLQDLSPFIHYLENTNDNEWAVDVVRTEGNVSNCLFGHLVNWAYGTTYKGNISPIWSAFEELWSTTFYVYEVNDGNNPKYQQSTPKSRCIAYIKDLWLGIEDTVWSSMEKEYQARLADGRI